MSNKNETTWPTHGPDFNAWNDGFDKFADLLSSVANDPWWIVDFDLKYLNIRIDTRDNGFLLLSEDKDGKRERISPDRVVKAIDKYHASFGAGRGVKDKPSEKKAKAKAARNKVSQSPDYEDLGDLARKRFPKVRKALHADEAKATKGETE